MEIWKKYIEDLFNDVRQEIQQVDVHSGSPITVILMNALRTSKNRKANGPDDIPM